jgi:hypothetical protein
MMAHMRVSRRGDLDTPSIKYFLVEDDDGRMPGSDASDQLIATDGRDERDYHIPSICLPTSCIDIALTMPLLRSYTYSFTGEGMTVMENAFRGRGMEHAAVHCNAYAWVTRPTTNEPSLPLPCH